MIKYALLALLALGATGAHAQGNAKLLWEPGVWQPGAADSSICQADFGYVNPPVLVSLESSFEELRLRISGERLNLSPKPLQDVTVILSTNPGLKLKAGRVYDIKFAENEVFKSLIIDVPPSFTAEFARSTFLKIKAGRKIIIDVPLVTPELAVSKVNSCREQRAVMRAAEAQRIAAWPQTRIEELARVQAMLPKGLPAQIPTPANLQSWFMTDDYPTRALREERSGRVGMLIVVGADGLPKACAIEQSSGSYDLDTHSCKLVMLRAKFNPAQDPNGQPVDAYMTKSIDWQVPRL